jgi:hypothetical protein
MPWLRRDRREGREGIKYTRADVNAAINESTINNMAISKSLAQNGDCFQEQFIFGLIKFHTPSL